MNAREQSLLVALIAVVGLGVGGIAIYKWFVQPLLEYRGQIVELEEKRDDEEAKWRVFVSERMKLARARTRSLPAKPEQAKSEYSIAYLDPLLKESGLRDVSITPSGPTEVKLAAPIPGIKKTGHQVLTFTVRATGGLSNLVAALDRMQRTPYEHRVKVLQIDREQPGLGKSENNKLLINMVIETLLVSRSEGKAGLSPTLEPRALDRKYEDIAKKNIFVGEVPEYKYEKQKEIVKKEEDKSPKAPAENVPAYVRLVHTSPELQEAYLRNRVYNTPEIRVNLANPKLGMQTFKITDELGVYEFFTAKVLRVDAREIYFQVKDQVYTLHVDQSVYEAMKNPLPLPLWRLGSAAAGASARVYPTLFDDSEAAATGVSPHLHPFLTQRHDPFGLVQLYDADWAANEKIRQPKSKSKNPFGSGFPRGR